MTTSQQDSSTRTFTTIEYTVDGGIATARFDRPEVLNAFSSQMYGELKGAIRLAVADDTVDAVVITGTGRAFATGGDLREVLACLAEPTGPLDIYRFEDNLPFDAIRGCPKPTIAAINGTCMAGGLITAMSCDIAIAVDDAVFAAPEARIGLAESWVPALMFGRISLSKMKYLTLTGKAIPAREAERIGLITEVAADIAALRARVGEIVGELRATSPNARRLYKDYINALVPNGSASDLYSTMFTEEGVEGLRAFVEKRPPRYGMTG
jgi:enoyl-CoA hydratase/carnithine racemase